MSKYRWADHEFDVYELGSVSWTDVGGVYIFAGPKRIPGPGDPWLPLYIGQTESFADRLPDHDMTSAAVEWGATHIHARIVSEERKRQLLEAILIKEYQPLLNVQLK